MAAAMTYTCDRPIGSKVTVDDARDIVATVTAIMWRDDGIQLEVCWFHQGAHHALWVSEWRVTDVEGRG